MFINYLSTMMFSNGVALLLLAAWVYRDFWKGESGFAPVFIVLGVVKFLLAYNMVTNWVLPSVYNIVFGEADLFFSSILVSLGLSLYWGKDRIGVYILSFTGGVLSLVLGWVIYSQGFTKYPVQSFLMFAIVALAGLLVLPVHFLCPKSKGKYAHKFLVFVLAVAALVWLFAGLATFISHLSHSSFGKWKPKEMVQRVQMKKNTHKRHISKQNGIKVQKAERAN